MVAIAKSDGRRVQRIDAAGNVRNYLWDFENVLLEINDSGTRKCLHTFEPALYGNLVSENRYEGTGQRFYHFDGLGSTVALTITTTSTPSPWHYQAFGKPLEGGDLFTPYRWLGQIGYQLQFTPGLLGSGYVEGTFDFANYYVRRRWLDLWTGRWTSRDIIPVGPHDVNSFMYAGNNPLNEFDPSGQISLAPLGALAILKFLLSSYCLAESIIQARKFSKDDKEAHCLGACYYNSCIGYFLPAETFVGLFAWELLGGWVKNDSWQDIRAGAWGIIQSYYPGSCAARCKGCRTVLGL